MIEIWQRSVRVAWNLAFVLILNAGLTAGWYLSLGISTDFEKHLIFVGIACSCVGFMLLTYLVSANERWKHWLSHILARLVVYALFLVPVGMMQGALLAMWLNSAPSASEVMSFVAPMFLGSLILVFTLEDSVIEPKFSLFHSTENRVKALGGFFTLLGFALAGLGAYVDMTGTMWW